MKRFIEFDMNLNLGLVYNYYTTSKLRELKSK